MGLGLSGCRVFIIVDDAGVAMALGAIISAMPTPDFRSLGSVQPSCSAPREVCALRPSPIGHKCAAVRGARGPLMRRSVGHEREVD
jgi:hypothetical protein